MPIPKKAKAVFQGNQFSVYQWEETLFDGSKAVFEAARRSNSAKAVAITLRGTVLVVEEEQPWRGKITTLPGGIMEEGENPEEAVRREVLEETGYLAKTLVPLLSEKAWYRLDCEQFTFAALGCEKVAEQSLDAWEKITVTEMPLDDFLEAVMDGKVRARDLQREFLLEYRKDPSLDALKKKLLGE